MIKIFIFFTDSILKSVFITIFQIIIYMILFALYLQNKKFRDKTNQIIKFIFIRIIYIFKMMNEKNQITIESLLSEKFNNYIKFLLSSSMKPNKTDKMINNDEKIDPMLKIIVLFKTYEAFINKDNEFDIDGYINEYWLKKYKVDKNNISNDDFEKFKKYHLMFYDLVMKYQKKVKDILQKH